ncbi:MAG: hypothetical protein ABIO71_12200, partial [Caldimonas sp.]
MNRTFLRSTLATTAGAALLAACAGGSTMMAKTGPSFFVSSTGSGQGGDLGGLAGADRLCSSLATAAGLGNRTWR